MKEGDKLIILCNLMRLEEMARKREELAKAYRLALWKEWKKKESNYNE